MNDTKKLDSKRTQITEKQSALKNLDACLLDLPTVKAKIASDLDSVGTLSDLDYHLTGYSAQRGEPFDWRKTPRWCDLLQIFRLEIEAYILRVNEPFTKQGLPPSEIAAKRESLLAELRELETQEEMEILRREATGSPVVRRGDVNGKLILEIWNAEDNTDERTTS